jgi:hypothetical protein
MGFTDQSIREKADIEERPNGLKMTVTVYVSDSGWMDVNGRPVTARGDEGTTFAAAGVIMHAHLVDLAVRHAKRRRDSAA